MEAGFYIGPGLWALLESLSICIYICVYTYLCFFIYIEKPCLIDLPEMTVAHITVHTVAAVAHVQLQGARQACQTLSSVSSPLEFFFIFSII